MASPSLDCGHLVIFVHHGERQAAVEGSAMILAGACVLVALGHKDMRKGMQGLALLVQQSLKRNPHGADLFVFRGRAGSLIKIIWHEGIGMSLYARRLEKGRFVWPLAKEGTVPLILAFHVVGARNTAFLQCDCHDAAGAQ